MTYHLGDKVPIQEPPGFRHSLKEKKGSVKILLNLLLLYRRKQCHRGLESLILEASKEALEEEAVSAMFCLREGGHYKYSLKILDDLIISLEERSEGSGSIEEIIHLLLQKFMLDGDGDYFGSLMYLTEEYHERLSAMLILKRKYNGYWKVLANGLLEETKVKEWAN